MSMNPLIIIDALLVAKGAYSFVTGKYLGGYGDTEKKYTEESLEKYTRVQGAIAIATGVAFYAVQTTGIISASFNGFGAMLVVAGVACLASFVVGKTMLKKRGAKAGCKN